MAEETKKCPYCCETIKADSEKCEFCGENLVKPQEILMKKADEFLNLAKENLKKINLPKIKINKWVIIAIVLIALAATGVSISCKIDEASADNIFKETIECKTPTDYISAINSDEKLLKEYLSQKHMQSSKEKAFNLFQKRFYKNLQGLNQSLKVWEYFEYHFDYAHAKLAKKGTITYKKLTFKLAEDGTLLITSHNAPFIRMPADGEGSYYCDFNYNYLNKTFGDLIGGAGKEYLEQMAKEEKEHGAFSYTADGAITVEKQEIKNRLIFWMNFRKKHANFVEQSNVLKNLINMYTCYLINDAYQTWDYNTLENGQSKITDKAKQIYEDFLKEGDKNTIEYQTVKKCYELLKSNNFRNSDEFYDALNEFSQSYSPT